MAIKMVIGWRIQLMVQLGGTNSDDLLLIAVQPRTSGARAAQLGRFYSNVTSNIFGHSLPVM